MQAIGATEGTAEARLSPVGNVRTLLIFIAIDVKKIPGPPIFAEGCGVLTVLGGGS